MVRGHVTLAHFFRVDTARILAACKRPFFDYLVSQADFSPGCSRHGFRTRRMARRFCNRDHNLPPLDRDLPKPRKHVSAASQVEWEAVIERNHVQDVADSAHSAHTTIYQLSLRILQSSTLKEFATHVAPEKPDAIYKSRVDRAPMAQPKGPASTAHCLLHRPLLHLQDHRDDEVRLLVKKCQPKILGRHLASQQLKDRQVLQSHKG
jgi:hypothetical protein